MRRAMRLNHMLLILAAITWTACDKKAPAGGEEPSPTAPAEENGEGAARADAPKEEDAPAPAEEEPPKVLEEAAIKGAVDAWLAAQNEGDFDTYKAQYAEKFFGIKRVGPKTYTYDRAGWVKDRGRMFKKKMEVTVADMTIKPSTQSAVVVFTQTWASGSYKDVGPKQLVLAQDKKGELKIAREEMLSSTIADGAEAPPLIAPKDFGFYRAADHALLVVADEAPEGVIKGKVRSVSRGYAAIAEADASKLSADVKALEGKEVAFYGAAGEVCKGKVTGFAVFGEATPHFGNFQYWDDTFGDEGGKKSDAFVARELMGLASNGGQRLVAVTDRAAADCEGAAWGRVAEGDAPKIAPFSKVTDAALRAKAVAALRALPAHVKIQRSHYEGKTPWDEDSGKNQHTIMATEGEDRLVFLHIQAGEGCGGFYGELWALWEQRGDDLVLLSDGKAPHAFYFYEKPVAAVDLDGDGKREVVSKDYLLQPVGPVWRRARLITPPNFDCGC